MTDDPACARMRLLVQADHDGELAAGEAAEVAAHLAGCAACRAVRVELAAVSAELRAMPRHAAPDSLRRSMQASYGAAPPRAARSRWRATAGVGVAMALAASVALFLAPRGGQDNAVAASHIRALQPGHLTDVLSSDQHTVKPWFDGRLDYAPPVRDFADAGFPLIGGRLDYLDHRAVAALVYRRAKHLIDVYVWPGTDSAPSAEVDGYNVVGWTADGMRFTAVSDLNAAELAQFAALWTAAR